MRLRRGGRSGGILRAAGAARREQRAQPEEQGKPQEPHKGAMVALDVSRLVPHEAATSPARRISAASCRPAPGRAPRPGSRRRPGRSPSLPAGTSPRQQLEHGVERVDVVVDVTRSEQEDLGSSRSRACSSSSSSRASTTCSRCAWAWSSSGRIMTASASVGMPADPEQREARRLADSRDHRRDREHFAACSSASRAPPACSTQTMIAIPSPWECGG